MLLIKHNHDYLAPSMSSVLKTTRIIPIWLDRATGALIEDIIRLLSERYPDLLAVILYGSVARHEERPLGAFNPSDVDLLAMFDSDDPLFDVLYWLLGTSVHKKTDFTSPITIFF